MSTRPMLEVADLPPSPHAGAHRHRLALTVLAVAVGLILIAAGLAITEAL